jgi:hypothetical protein
MKYSELKRTSNAERRTPNAEWKQARVSLSLERWALNVGRWTFAFALIGSSIAVADAPVQHRPLPSLMQWEAGGAQKDPIMSIDHKMGHIVDDLSEQKTDQPVQSQQKQVIADLDTIIKQMEQQQKSGTSTKKNGRKPAEKSTLAKGPGGQGPLHDPKAGTQDWAKLSAKEREQITQSQTEGFPPGYEAVLSSYYSRLAAEKVADEGGAAPAGPTTQPAGK